MFTAGFLARLPYEGHLHADETSWQVFEDVAGKDGHRWWLWVFVTDATTVFVMDTSRTAKVAAAQLGTGREQTALEAGRHLVIPSDFHKAYQSLDGIDAHRVLQASDAAKGLLHPAAARGVSKVLSARPLATSTERAVIVASGLLVLATSGRSWRGLADIARRLQAWEVDPG